MEILTPPDVFSHNRAADFIKDNIDTIRTRNLTDLYYRAIAADFTANIISAISYILIRSGIDNPLKYVNNAVPYGCFAGLAALDIDIPTHITEIGPFAYKGFFGEKIVIPGNVRRIDKLAFNNSKRLKSVTLEEGVEHLDMGVCSQSNELQLVVLPNSIKSLGASCFEYCTKLFEVIYNGTIEEYRNVSVGRHCFDKTNVAYVICKDGEVVVYQE